MGFRCEPGLHVLATVFERWLPLPPATRPPPEFGGTKDLARRVQGLGVGRTGRRRTDRRFGVGFFCCWCPLPDASENYKPRASTPRRRSFSFPTEPEVHAWPLCLNAGYRCRLFRPCGGWRSPVQPPDLSPSTTTPARGPGSPAGLVAIDVDTSPRARPNQRLRPARPGVGGRTDRAKKNGSEVWSRFFVVGVRCRTPPRTTSPVPGDLREDHWALRRGLDSETWPLPFDAGYRCRLRLDRRSTLDQPKTSPGASRGWGSDGPGEQERIGGLESVFLLWCPLPDHS